MTALNTQNFTVTCHIAYANGGRVVNITHRDDRFTVTPLPPAQPTGLEPGKRPMLLGVTPENKALLLNPISGTISEVHELPPDTMPHYAYRDTDSGRMWFSNDGDEDSGHDAITCPAGGAPIIVVASRGGAQRLTTQCIGRGHHVVTFTFPSTMHPAMPKLAFVSNLLDGNISVFGNDPAKLESFLKVIGTVDLIEPEKEKAGSTAGPNNAFPHGMVYSPVTGKIYNLNNGYGTITVIDPISLSITGRIKLAKCSNLLLDPTGCFVVAKGADRKTNADHVIGQLVVVDLLRESIVATVEIPDFYPSTFRFDPSGRRLYVTSAATGKGSQRNNLSINSILVYDARRLPEMKQLPSLQVGRADCGRRPLAFFPVQDTPQYVFFPNPTDGTMSVLDGRSNEICEVLQLGDADSSEILFSFWDGLISGS